ncbi:hypothetical protein F4780DRAFT_33810 [Xylariomycetidae sp. FL0641]|nr:hypothetical protein F4780DRAFT_33810 [Xylariomycetidae sp. FL0641]
MASREIPTLIPLEKAGPQGYIRYMFPLELPGSYSLEATFSLLRHGLEAAKARLPIWGCELVPDPAAQQAGVLRLQPYADDHQTLVAKDLRAPAAYPYAFAELKAKAFPTAAFPGDLLWRRDTWPAAPGERLPAADLQANFIRGGLLLTCAVFHVVGDATAWCVWLETWAEECRLLQHPAAPRREIPEVLFTDREKHLRPSGRNAGRAADHPEILVLPVTPTSAPAKMRSRAHVGQGLRVSRERLAALKADAAPARALQPTDVAYTTTNDALSALMWGAVMRAQFPPGSSLGAAEDPESVFNIAIDARARADPPVHPRTLGNWLGWVAPRMRVRALLDGSAAGIADAACVIRRAVAGLTDQYVDDLGALFEGVEDVRRVIATAFTDMPGLNCVQTSWYKMTVYGLDWGEKLGGRIQAVRSPDVGVVNGGCLVLPALPDGGIELIIGVEEKCLPRLLEDPLLAKYAQAITL